MTKNPAAVALGRCLRCKHPAIVDWDGEPLCRGCAAAVAQDRELKRVWVGSITFEQAYQASCYERDRIFGMFAK